MRYYLIVGEASGDLHAANLMAAIRQKDSAAEFRFFGGDKMQAQGGELAKHYREMAFMGFVEVLFNLRKIAGFLKYAKKDVLDWKPDVLILVDYAGFNLRMAAYAKKNSIRTVYYISPKLWAWNTKRVEKVKRSVDKMLLILPFEKEFYEQHGYLNAEYVGNPLMDELAAFQPDPQFLAEYRLSDKPIIALLPGSRKQEIEKLLPVMVEGVRAFSKTHHIVVAGVPHFDRWVYKKAADGFYTIIYNNTYNIVTNAAVGVVASGTAALETALLRMPQVVCYKASPLTIAIARMVIKIKYISLANLILDKLIFKELIQQDCTPERIEEELERLLKDAEYRSQQLSDYEAVAEKTGGPGASERAAASIVNFVNSKE